MNKNGPAKISDSNKYLDIADIHHLFQRFVKKISQAIRVGQWAYIIDSGFLLSVADLSGCFCFHAALSKSDLKFYATDRKERVPYSKF
jgi:hypothetical protein